MHIKELHLLHLAIQRVWLIATSCSIEALIEAALAMIKNIQNRITAIALNLVPGFISNDKVNNQFWSGPLRWVLVSLVMGV
jgi:hypothetical protein